LKSQSIIEVTFRAAGRNDVPALAALDRLCFSKEAAYGAKTFDDILDWRGSWHIVAEQKGAIIGFVAAVPYGKFAHFITLDIHPDFRNAGLGNALMSAIEQMIFNSGYKTAVLEVETDNAAAVELYKKRGYVVRGKIDNYYENGKDAYVMSKAL